MYRIIILNNGKYHNVNTGNRYCFTKRATKSVVNTLVRAGCEIEVEKFVHLCDGVFAWSIIHPLSDYVTNKLEELWEEK